MKSWLQPSKHRKKYLKDSCFLVPVEKIYQSKVFWFCNIKNNWNFWNSEPASKWKLNHKKLEIIVDDVNLFTELLASIRKADEIIITSAVMKLPSF